MKSRIRGERVATERWVRERIRLYAAHAGLTRADRPKVEFGPCRGGAETSAGNKAEYDYMTNTIRVDLGVTLCRHDADDSAAHEIVHARWKSLRHNGLFHRRILALREGHKCGPRGATLPAAFK